jgi:hypothetical protein
MLDSVEQSAAPPTLRSINISAFLVSAYLFSGSPVLLTYVLLLFDIFSHPIDIYQE